jgi:hypothetical protein
MVYTKTRTAPRSLNTGHLYEAFSMVTSKKSAKPPKTAKAPKKSTKKPAQGTPKKKKGQRGPAYVINRQKVMSQLCDLLSCSHKSLATCLNEVNETLKLKVAPTMIYDWMIEDTELANRYARAKQEQADFLVEEMLAISDDDSQDAIFVEVDDKSGKSAKMICNNEFIQRSRLRVDTRKWIASKLKPKKYGDKLEIETSDDGHPLIVVTSAVGFLPVPSKETKLLENKPDEE